MNRITLPRFFERLAGLTLPAREEMYIADYNEVYRVGLNDLSVEITGENPYDFMSDNFTLGVSGHAPLVEVGDKKIKHDFDPSQPTRTKVQVEVHVESETHPIEFPIASGDWFYASFSKDSCYVVVAEPYDFWVYRL